MTTNRQIFVNETGPDPHIEEWNTRIEAIGRSWLSICRSIDPPIHHSLIARWRSGETRPTFRTAERFVAALVYAERQHMATLEAHIEEIGQTWRKICKLLKQPVDYSVIERWRNGEHSEEVMREVRRFYVALRHAERRHAKKEEARAAA